MQRLSVFHSRSGAAALAAALHYSYGPAGQAELLPGLRHLSTGVKQPRGFVRPHESVLVIADHKRQTAFRTAISSVVSRFRPDVELVFYALPEYHGPLTYLGLYLLGRGLLPGTLVNRLTERIWDSVSRR